MLDDILESVKAKAKQPKIVRIRKWIWNSTMKSDLAWIWCSCIAWNRLPSWLCKPVTVIYTTKNGVTDMYCDQEEMDACKKMVADKIISDKSTLDKISSDCQIEQDKLMQVATDLDSTKFGGLPDEIIYKIYEILLDQYTNLQKYNNICEAAINEGKKRESEISQLSSGSDPETKNLADMLVEMNRLKSQIDSAFSKTQEQTKKFFNEISKRTGQKEAFVMSMTPEEIKYAIHTGKIEDWEIQGRFTHYIMIYDWEKDDPLVYTLEKARVMELSFKFEKPSQ